MQFSLSEDKSGYSVVADYLINQVDGIVAQKIAEKLELFEKYPLEHLLRAEHLKKLDHEIYEVRIRIDKKCYRLLGATRGSTLEIVHIFYKKTQKTPKREIQITKERLKKLN